MHNPLVIQDTPQLQSNSPSEAFNSVMPGLGEHQANKKSKHFCRIAASQALAHVLCVKEQ